MSFRNPWFDVERIHQSAEVFDKLKGDITKKIYPGKGHTIVEDEVKFIRKTIHFIIHNENI